MREQGLIVPNSGGDKVTAGALLLFGKRTLLRQEGRYADDGAF